MLKILRQNAGMAFNLYKSTVYVKTIKMTGTVDGLLPAKNRQSSAYSISNQERLKIQTSGYNQIF
jgi:hypothetical protein